MKRMWIVWGGFIVLFVVFGVVFVFGDKIFEVVEDRSPFFGESLASGEDDVSVDDVDLNGDEIDGVVAGDSSEGGGEGSGGSSGGSSPGCTRFQYVQYSLSNFVEEAECLVYGVGGCEQVRIVCSSKIFNMDYEIGGNFGIVYSLTSGNDSIGSERMEKEVEARTSDVLRVEVIKDGLFDVNSLGCSIDMEIVPKRWLC